MQEKIGFCGLYCGCCTMYRAYHDENSQLLKEAPKNFRQRFDLENATPESIACNGCRSSKPLDYCASCEIRNNIGDAGEKLTCYPLFFMRCLKFSICQLFTSVPFFCVSDI